MRIELLEEDGSGRTTTAKKRQNRTLGKHKGEVPRKKRNGWGNLAVRQANWRGGRITLGGLRCLPEANTGVSLY